MIRSCPRCGETILITPDRCLRCGKQITLADRVLPRPVLDFYERQKTRLAAAGKYRNPILGAAAILAVLAIIALAFHGISAGRTPAAAMPATPNATLPVTTTQPPPTGVPRDPVIGTWQWTLYDRSKTIFYTFAADGQYSTSDSKNQGREYGTWVRSGENQYRVTVGGTQEILYDYQPATGTIAKHDAPDILIYPQGMEPGTNVSSPNKTAPAANQINAQTCQQLRAAGFTFCDPNVTATA